MQESSALAGSSAAFHLTVSPNSPTDFEMWRASVSPMFEIAPLSQEERDAFSMETHGFFFPGMAVTKTTSSACTFDRSRDVIARSGIENILVQLYTDGSYLLHVEGLRTLINPGDVVVFDLKQECSIEATSYTNVAVTLQRDLLAPLIVDMDRLHGIVLRNGEPRNALLKSHLLMMHAEAINIGRAEQAAVVQGTAALFAACLGPSMIARERRAASEPVTKLQAIRHAIDSNLGDLQLGPDALARQFGLSRASIYRLFEPLGGVRSYIQQRRLMHAYQLISSPANFDESIATIAAKTGFAESTTFSRAFRNLYRMTPSDVRNAARSGVFTNPHAPQSGESSFWMLNRWLLGLDANGE